MFHDVLAMSNVMKADTLKHNYYMQEHIAQGSPSSLRISDKTRNGTGSIVREQDKKMLPFWLQCMRKVGAEASSEGEIKLVQKKETDLIM